MNVGKQIRSYRELKGWTQIDLANASGINVNTIRKYELGIRNPKAEQVEKIADALQVNRSLFYDLNIQSVGDVMSLLFAIDNAVYMDISEISKDDKVTYVFDFKNSHMREALHQWCRLKIAYANDLKEAYKIEDKKLQEVVLAELEKNKEETKMRIMLSIPERNYLISKDIKGIGVKVTDW